jgi:hypothetical protein
MSALNPESTVLVFTFSPSFIYFCCCHCHSIHHHALSFFFATLHIVRKGCGLSNSSWNIHHTAHSPQVHWTQLLWNVRSQSKWRFEIICADICVTDSSSKGCQAATGNLSKMWSPSWFFHTTQPWNGWDRGPISWWRLEGAFLGFSVREKTDEKVYEDAIKK